MADETDLERLHHRTFEAVFRACHALAGDRELASDATQEAFPGAQTRWSRLSGAPWAAGWVMRTALNIVRRSLRRRALLIARRARRRTRRSRVSALNGGSLLAVVLTAALAVLAPLVGDVDPDAAGDGDVPMLEPRAGWWIAAGTIHAPRTWAATVPFDQYPDLTGEPPLQQIPPGVQTFPERSIRDLGLDDIAIVAWYPLAHVVPAPAGNPNFPDASLPLDLSGLVLEPEWEGAPAGPSSRFRILARINERYVEVSVYLGTPRPSADVIAEAEDELATLEIPRPGSSVYGGSRAEHVTVFLRPDGAYGVPSLGRVCVDGASWADADGCVPVS